MSKIEQIIDEIEEFIDGCKLQPFSSNKIIVDKAELEELLSELRSKTPDEIRKYQKILTNKDAIISDAQAQADKIIEDAKSRAEALTNSHDIMKEAQSRATKIINDATEQAQGIVDNAVVDADNIRSSAISYTDEMLGSLQAIVSHSMEGAQTRFTSLMNSLQASYDIITDNRKELNPEEEGTEGYIEEEAAEEEYTQEDASEEPEEAPEEE